jgi:RNA polymerase sigma factor (TIGR02999 family)
MGIMACMTDVTQILNAIQQGDPQASEELLPLVYEELRVLARQRLAHEKPGQTLQATALVHEAYLRLVGKDNDQSWNNRGHFFGAAAEAMRRILIENARKKKQEKRGGRSLRVPIPEEELSSNQSPEELLELDDALQTLEEVDAAAAELFKLCYFASISVEQAAELLGTPRTSAYRQWKFARAWLSRQFITK